MIAAALLLKLLSQRRLAPLLPGLAAFALVLVVLIANLAPTVVYHAQHGGNSAEVHSASQGDRLGDVGLLPGAAAAARSDRAAAPPDRALRQRHAAARLLRAVLRDGRDDR